MRKLFTAQYSRISAAERGVFYAFIKRQWATRWAWKLYLWFNHRSSQDAKVFSSRFKILSAPVDLASQRPSALAQNPLAALYLLERQSICCQGIYGLLILSNNSDWNAFIMTMPKANCGFMALTMNRFDWFALLHQRESKQRAMRIGKNSI